jgi:hypothetical protein
MNLKNNKNLIELKGAEEGFADILFKFSAEFYRQGKSRHRMHG